MANPIPTKLLERICEVTDEPLAIAMCPDFELGSWRYKSLADHIFDWLPDVALRPSERDILLFEPHKQLARACRRLFDTDDPEKRGELGEILIHAVCRQEFGTIPFIARLFYKMRTNDSVTSIDVAHLLFDASADRLELWLGEAKLYDDFSGAKYAALNSIKPLWSPDFLHEMKALIGPKIEAETPYAAKLANLFAEETTLDEIIDAIVIPICIAVDRPHTTSSSSRNDNYISAVMSDLEDMRSYFSARVPVSIRFMCILIPMDDKEKLETAVNKKVQAFL